MIEAENVPLPATQKIPIAECWVVGFVADEPTGKFRYYVTYSTEPQALRHAASEPDTVIWHCPPPVCACTHADRPKDGAA